MRNPSSIEMVREPDWQPEKWLVTSIFVKAGPRRIANILAKSDRITVVRVKFSEKCTSESLKISPSPC
jgi:hypothetical protein